MMLWQAGPVHVRRLVIESGDKFRQIVDKAIEITKGCNCSPSCLLGNVSDRYSTVHLKAVNKSDTYILAGILRFTMNVDCSAPAVFIYGCTMLGNDFQEVSVRRLIFNEVYVGDIQRQKCCMADPITKAKVQAEMERRAAYEPHLLFYGEDKMLNDLQNGETV